MAQLLTWLAILLDLAGVGWLAVRPLTRAGGYPETLLTVTAGLLAMWEVIIVNS